MMSTFEEIRNDYPDWEPAYPSDWPKPTLQEIENIQYDYGIKYPQEFIKFQLTECHITPMGDFAFDNFGWAESSLGPMENLRTIVEDAMQVEVPINLAPFKHDNGDYFCFTESGGVVLWDHNSNMVEQDQKYQWISFTEWLHKSFENE
nr:SMI1/KNR4 family protein [uncultured Desulfobacter sp.]